MYFSVWFAKIYCFDSGGGTIYAIVESGGKQYIASPGSYIDVEKLEIAEGEQVKLDRVLLVSNDGKLKIGNPTVKDTCVVATCKSQFKDDKVIIFKYKPKGRYNVKSGHRQNKTRLVIDEISLGGAKKAKAATKPKAEAKTTAKTVAKTKAAAPKAKSVKKTVTKKEVSESGS